MDERFNRRLLLLISGLVLVFLAVAVLTLREFVTGIDGLVKWPMWLAVSFNVMVLVATAVITVGHFDRRLVARFFALVVACKAVATVLTAAGFVLTTGKQALAGIWPAFTGALLEAGLESWSASVLHAIGALVVARVLRSMVMGRRLAIEAPPEGIILPTITEPEMVAGAPGKADEMWLAPPEPGVDPFTSPAAAEREQAEGEEELDRVVAAAAPATADLEAMPDQTAPEPEPEEVVGYAEAVSETEAVSEEEVVAEAEAVPEADVFSDVETEPSAEPEAAAEEEETLESVTELAPEPWEPEAAAPIAAAAEEPVEPELEAAATAVAEFAEPPGGEAAEVLLSIGEILGCFADEDVALTQSEVREERGGDEYVRVPLDVVLPQIENGVVQVEADLIFNQLPRAAFSRSPEEIAGSLWQGKVELPLARVVDQLPPDAMRRSYEAEQESVDQFPEPFKDTLAAAPRRPSEPVAREAAPQVAEAPEEAPPEPTEHEASEPEAAEAAAPVEEVEEIEEVEEELAEAPVSLEPAAEEVPPEPLEEPEPVAEPEPEPAPAVEEIAAAAPEQDEIQEVEEPEEAEEAVPAAPEPAAAASPPGALSVSAEYVVAQFPENAMAMPIEDIEAKLDPHGRLHVPVDDVLPQLAEGYIAVDVVPLLEQLPPGAVGMSWGELANALPDGKVQLPLDQVVGQIPPDMLVPGVAQTEQETTEHIPEPFAERRTGPVRAVAAEEEPAAAAEEEPAAEEAVEPPAPLEEAAPLAEAAPPTEAEVVPEAVTEPVAEPEPEPSADIEEVAAAPEAVPEEEAEEPLEEAPVAAADTIEIPWVELLPQFPADAFCVSRDQLNSKLEGSMARVGVDIVRPQLAEGRVTVPCGYLLAQFPDEYLELTVEQVSERVLEGRFELPLVSLILQLPEEELALPAEQTLQESAEEIPTVFAEPGAEESAPEPTEEPVEAAEAAPSEIEAEPEPEPEPEAVAEAAEAEWTPEAPEEVAEPAAEVAEPSTETAEPSAETAEPPAEPGELEGLTESDITQLETLLAGKRQEEAAFEDEGEFIDDLFVSDEGEAPDVRRPVLEPEQPSAVEEPAAEATASEADVAEPVEAERAAEPPFELDEVEAPLEPLEEPALEPTEEPLEPAEEPAFEPVAEEPLEPVEEPTFAPTTELLETVEEAAPELAAEPVELVEEPAFEPTEEEVAGGAPEGGAPEAEAPEAEPAVAAAPAAGKANLAAAAHDKEAFRDLLHGYAKYHVEHGSASYEAGRLVFSFTPAETSAEVLARELSPRFGTLARLADSLGCEPIERAVLMADKGAVVCEWLPEEAGAGLVLIATTDRRAAGMMHLQARRDTGFMGQLSAELRAESGAAAVEIPATDALPGHEPEGCEIAWPDGHPYDQIGDLLGSYDIAGVAQLQFDSGARWMLASPALDERGLSAQGASTGAGPGCYNPSELFELPEELRLGRVQSVLAMAGRHVITVNAPGSANAPAGDAVPSGSEPGLICVFPGQFREGLLKMKADKASALLCRG